MPQVPSRSRAITPTDAKSAIKPFEDAIETVAGTALDVFTDRPGFVASNDPVNPLSAAVRAVTRLNCRRWAAADKSGFSSRVNAYNSTVCTPYLDSIGETPNEGSAGPPFTGGQCNLVYIFEISGHNTTTGVAFTQKGKSWGPIRGASSRVEGGINRFYVTSGGNPIESALCSGSNGSPGPVQSRQFGGSRNSAQIVTGISIVQVCSGTDTCGNPPPEIRPPSNPVPPPSVPPGVTVSIPGIGPITVNVDLDPDGDPVFRIPSIGVDIGVELGGGSDPVSGPGTGPPPGDVGSPGTPVETGPGGSGPDGSTGPGAGEAEGVAPEGSELVGLRMELLAEPPSRTKYTDMVRRGAVYVYMGVPGLLDHDPAGAMITDDQFIFAEREGLTAWRVRANKGYSFRTTPYYREVA